MNYSNMGKRKLATILATLVGKYAIYCAHCNKLLMINFGELKEVERVNLDQSSASVTYNFVCKRCNGENQINTVIEDKP